jgi:hypothetical protein
MLNKTCEHASFTQSTPPPRPLHLQCLGLPHTYLLHDTPAVEDAVTVFNNLWNMEIWGLNSLEKPLLIKML